MPSLRLPKLVRRNPDRPTLKERAVALRATAAKVMRRKPADPLRDGPCPPGFVPYPFDDPQSFMHVTGVLRVEGERLLRIAVKELDRRLDDMDRRGREGERQADEALHRRLLRIDALMVLAGRMEAPVGSVRMSGDDAELLALGRRFDDAARAYLAFWPAYDEAQVAARDAFDAAYEAQRPCGAAYEALSNAVSEPFRPVLDHGEALQGDYDALAGAILRHPRPSTLDGVAVLARVVAAWHHDQWATPPDDRDWAKQIATELAAAVLHLAGHENVAVTGAPANG